MRYKKPEVICLGEATHVIQNGTKAGPGFEPLAIRQMLMPNYDLDD